MNRYISRIFCVIFTLSIIVAFSGCSNPKKEKEYTIGFSQCTMDDVWRSLMFKEMEREAFLIKGTRLNIILKDANNNIDVQKNDIRNLVRDGLDVLIVSPQKSEPLKHLIDSVAGLNIPVILIDRHISTDKSVYYIGANNHKIGEAAGKEVMRLLSQGGNVLSFTGLKGSKPAIERSNGFNSINKIHTQYRLKNIECDWTEETAYLKMKALLKNGTSFHLIFAHNDFMAKGIIKALNEAKQTLPPIIGVDGLNTPGFGIDMVLDSLLSATFTYPTGGDVAIQTAYKILTQKDVSLYQELNSIKIDYSNAKAIKIQRNEIDGQIEKIDRQNELISNNVQEINLQRKKVKRVTAILLVVILLFAVIIYVLRKRKTESMAEENEFQYTYPIPFIANIKEDEKQFIDDLKKVVLDNLINQKLTIEFMASQFGISHSTIYRKIKLITGLKGVELINLIRMQYAEKLLSTTSLSIKEIAFQTGFSTSSYFSTSFLKQFGVSPVKFRKAK